MTQKKNQNLHRSSSLRPRGSVNPRCSSPPDSREPIIRTVVGQATYERQPVGKSEFALVFANHDICRIVGNMIDLWPALPSPFAAGRSRYFRLNCKPGPIASNRLVAFFLFLCRHRHRVLNWIARHWPDCRHHHLVQSCLCKFVSLVPRPSPGTIKQKREGHKDTGVVSKLGKIGLFRFRRYDVPLPLARFRLKSGSTVPGVKLHSGRGAQKPPGPA